MHVGNEARPLPPGTFVDRDNDADALFHVLELPVGLRLLVGSGPALSGLAIFIAALLGRRILLSIGVGRPFDHRNPRRFVGLAAALLVGGVGASALAWIASYAVLHHVGLDAGAAAQALYGPTTAVHLDGLWWALVALAVAEAFRRGRELTEDVEGLV